jgi:hypothetical protein
VKALDLASKQQYQEAFDQITRLEDLQRGVRMRADSRSVVETALLKAVLLLRLGRHAEALHAVAFVQERLPLKRLSADENRYLRCYSGAIGNKALKFVTPHVSNDQVSFFDLDPRGIDLAKVADHLKKNFPMQLSTEVIERPNPEC